MSREINNRYRIIREIGVGGMGEVYLVEDKVYNDLPIALKLIKPELINSSIIQSFKNEFEVMTRLKHPNLIQVYDFGIDRESVKYFMTMEYLPGKSLATMILENCFDLDTTLKLLIELCRALEFIHSRNIVHRDIKPANVVLVNDKVKVMDFGLADLNGGDKKRKGTLFYMAPEIINGTVSNKTDIYALGITIFEMVNRTKEFVQTHTKSMVSYLQNKDHFLGFSQKLLETVENPSLRKIIAKMTAFEPDARYTTAAEIIADVNCEFGSCNATETEKTKESYVLGAGFVGRAEEFNSVKGFLQEEEHNCFLVYGDAGIGKTRLMAELKKYCQLNEILFLEVSCFETIKKRYNPIIDLLNECLYLCSETALTKFGPELKKLLPSHEKLCNIQQNPPNDPQTQHRLFSKYITDFLIQFTLNEKHQISLYFNDIQWIDDASLEIVENLIGKLKQNQAEIRTRLKIFLSSRKEGLTYIRNLQAKSLIKTLELLSFDRPKVESFFIAVFGADKIGKNLLKSIDHITKQVGGNPFYLQEIIRSLITSDAISHKTLSWELTIKPEEITIPSGIGGLLLSRYKRLKFTNEERKVLEILSLLDREITFVELKKLFLVDLNVIQKIDYYEVLKKQIVKGDLYFKIHHDLIKEMVISEIHNKQELHNEIALRLESVHTADRDNYLYELGHHFYHGRNFEKASPYLETALNKAVQNYEYRRLDSLCVELFEIYNENKAKRVEVMVKKFRALYLVLPVEKMFEFAKEIIAQAEEVGDRKSRAFCYSRMGEICLNRIRDVIKAMEYLEIALNEYTAIHDKEGIADALNYIGLGYGNSGNFEKALETHKKSLAIAEEIGSELIIGYNVGNMGIIYDFLGDRAAALNAHMKALAAMTKLGNKENMIVGLGNIGSGYRQLGDFALALSYFEKAIAVAEEVEMFDKMADYTTRKAEMLFALAKIDEAQKLAAQNYEILKKLNMPNIKILGSGVLKAKIEHAKHNTEAVIQVFDQLKKDLGDEMGIAFVNYEKWKLTKDSHAQLEALSSFKKYYLEQPHEQYKRMIEELEGTQSGKE